LKENTGRKHKQEEEGKGKATREGLSEKDSLKGQGNMFDAKSTIKNYMHSKLATPLKSRSTKN